MQQIAVRAVDLHRVEAEPRGARAPPRRTPSRMLRQPRAIERNRRMLSVGERHGRRRNRLPAAWRIRRDLRAALPRHARRCLAAGVRELDRDRHVGPAAHALEHPRQRRFGVVRPQPEIARRDPPLGHHRRRLDRQQRRARKREMSEMDHVPVGRAPLVGRVLTHRRDDDAISEFQAADTVWRNRWAGISLRAESGDGIRRGETPCGHVDRDG